MVDTNEAYKPSQRWILLVGLESLVWAWLKMVCLTTILGLENNNCFPTLKSLPPAARLPVISQSKLLSTRQREKDPLFMQVLIESFTKPRDIVLDCRVAIVRAWSRSLGAGIFSYEKIDAQKCM